MKIIIVLLALALFSCEDKDIQRQSDLYNESKGEYTQSLNGDIYSSSQALDTTYYYKFNKNGILQIRNVNKIIQSQLNFEIIESEQSLGTLLYSNYIGESHYWVCDGACEITTGQMLYFTEWQPVGNGVFTLDWNTMDSPGVLGGIVYLYFHMNWGWGGSHDGWFAFNDVNSGNGNFKYARQNFYITKL